MRSTGFPNRREWSLVKLKRWNNINSCLSRITALWWIGSLQSSFFVWSHSTDRSICADLGNPHVNSTATNLTTGQVRNFSRGFFAKPFEGNCHTHTNRKYLTLRRLDFWSCGWISEEKLLPKRWRHHLLWPRHCYLFLSLSGSSKRRVSDPSGILWLSSSS